MTDQDHLLERIRAVLTPKRLKLAEKKMFGGMCFMVDDKMLMGTYKGGIMARVEPEEVGDLLQREGATQMIHGGRPMKGYLFLEPEAYDLDDDLEFWIQKCLEFNPKAKSSKKKTKK